MPEKSSCNDRLIEAATHRGGGADFQPTRWRHKMNLSLPIRTLLALLISAGGLGAIATSAAAANYVAADCSPGLNPSAPDAGYTSPPSHYKPRVDCSQGAAG